MVDASSPYYCSYFCLTVAVVRLVAIAAVSATAGTASAMAIFATIVVVTVVVVTRPQNLSPLLLLVSAVTNVAADANDGVATVAADTLPHLRQRLFRLMWLRLKRFHRNLLFERTWLTDFCRSTYWQK